MGQQNWSRERNLSDLTRSRITIIYWLHGPLWKVPLHQNRPRPAQRPKIFWKYAPKNIKGFDQNNIVVDDIIIYTKAKKENEAIIQKLLKKLNEHNIIINRDKSKFLLNEIDYLGFKLWKNGYIPDPGMTGWVRGMANTKEVERATASTRKG